MKHPSHTIKLEKKGDEIQFYWDDSPYHQEKIFPLLKDSIERNEHIILIVSRNETVELNAHFTRPEYRRMKAFILSFPKTKLYKSFYYFINDF